MGMSIQTETTRPYQSAEHPRRARRPLVIAGGAAAALALWVVAGPLLGADLAALPSPEASSAVEITASSVLISSLAAGLVGWALLAVLERITAHAATAWRWLAGAVTVLSLGGPLTLAEGTAATVTLTLLHLVVAAVLIPALPGRRR